jgi:hypothetical protein
VEWIHLAQGRDQWRALLNIVWWKISTSWATISFSGRTLIHELVNCLIIMNLDVKCYIKLGYDRLLLDQFQSIVHYHYHHHYSFGMCHEGLKKTTRNLSPDSWSPG